MFRRGQRVMTPIGPGEVVSAQVRDVYIRLPGTMSNPGGWRVLRRKRHVTVWVDGFSAPHDFDPSQVRPLKGGS